MESASFTTSQFPVVTYSLLADHEKLEATHSWVEINQSVFSLIKARKAIHDAKLAVACAKRENRDKKAVIERLDNILASLDALHTAFPLTLLDNGGGHERPSIMGNG